jgi:DNA-binding MarR family transcriptional regulator
MKKDLLNAADLTELVLRDWSREMPDLDTTGLGAAGRISLLAKVLALQLQRVVSPFGLQIWEYEVLAALRRKGAPYELTPTQLAEVAFLTTGAITNRIDRLEARGLVVRRPNPDDRRGLRVALTESGRQLAERAAGARMAEIRKFFQVLTMQELETLEGLLRTLTTRDREPVS